MQRFSTPEELAAEIGVSTDFIHVTIGLDKGCLAKNETTLYFLGPRMGGWEVVESSPLVDVTRVEQKSNFMGETTLIVCKSGRWQCKDVEDGVDVAHWLSSTVSVPFVPASPVSSRSSFDSTTTQLEQSQRSEIDETWESDDIVDALSESPSEIFEPSQPVQEMQSPIRSDESQPELSVEDMLSSTQDASEESGGGCVGTLVKWFIYLWIFSFVMDFCDSL